MSRSTARTLGALALAAALATSSTAALAATTSADAAFSLSKKRKATTLAGLSPEVRASAVRTAQSTPTGMKLTAEGRTSQGMSDRELDLICGGDWFITWEEDADGDPILGTFSLHCAGDEHSLP